jgi:hypothetical protein
MMLSVCKSDYFLERARQICLSPNEYVASPNTSISNGNYYSAGFLDAYIMATSALEAFINERLAIDLKIHNQRLNMPEYKDRFPNDSKEKDILNLLIKQNLENKYRLSPILLYNCSYDIHRYPFLDFTSLIKIRNDIVHYEMPFYDDKTEPKPKWVNFLKSKGIFLVQPVIHPPDSISDEGVQIWIEEICTFKGAKWAYNTSCSMIKEYYNLAEGIIKTTCQPWIDSIKEI